MARTKIGGHAPGANLIVAVFPGRGNEVLVLWVDGTLQRFGGSNCGLEKCLEEIGTLDLPNPPDQTYFFDAVVDRSGAEDPASLYVSHDKIIGDGTTSTFVVSRFLLPAEDAPAGSIKPVQVVFESEPYPFDPINNVRIGAGGALVLEPDGAGLLVTIGDFTIDGLLNGAPEPVGQVGEDPFRGKGGGAALAQLPESSLGKAIRIDLLSGQSAVLTSGHRNPQGLALSRTGELFLSEHGPKGGDEINLLLPGKNYGWPRVSMGAAYAEYTFPNDPLDSSKPHGGFEPPVTAFLPSIGISAIAFAEGFHEAWDGDLVISSLRAESLYRLRLWDGGQYLEHIPIGGRIRDLDFIGGTLYLVTDNGEIITLSPVRNATTTGTDPGLAGALGALNACAQCHNISSPLSSDFAPHLRGTVDREIGALQDFRHFSKALLALKGQTWTLENLRAFLSDPSRFAPGTTMPNPALSPDRLEEVLTALTKLQ